ncbi:PREDICTED: uncharacterized protein LOC106813184 [Priapulus caudatus]|uniref:Uncharacterized protein LOC106813184 n=1 Tax=Priapulus caudatus TaxID=37621 RepID=A0ABM1EKL9_PRICU|nr:PREDICTED: uncharacterized protein LOC106813184 [Priapulus caudatus]
MSLVASTGEEEDGAKIVTVETKQNTQTNEVISSGNVETCEVRCALSENLRQMITGSCAKMTSQSYLCVSTTKTTVGSGQEGDYEDNSDDEDLQNFSLCVPAESSSTHRHQITQEEAGLEPISHPAIQEDLLHGVEPSPDSDRATLEQDIMKFIQLWEEEREVNQQLIENLDRSNERIRDLGDELGFVSMDLHKLLKENRSLKEENEDLAMENQALISAIQNIKI